MCVQAGDELPMQSEAHDTMRRGLSALKDEAAVSHPVELIQGNVSSLHQSCIHANFRLSCSVTASVWTMSSMHIIPGALRAG